MESELGYGLRGLNRFVDEYFVGNCAKFELKFEFAFFDYKTCMRYGALKPTIKFSDRDGFNPVRFE